MAEAAGATKLWPLLGFLLLWSLLKPAEGYAAAACSSAVGKVVLNEYAHQQNYVETFHVNSGYSVAGWKVRIYTSTPTDTSACGSGCVEKFLPATSANTCDDYQVLSFGASQTPTSADIVLLDSNNDVVDILRARTSSGIGNLYPKPGCNFPGPSTDLPNVNSANKGIDRLPDGTGRWRNTPGTGSGSYLTRCAVNQADLTTKADLAMTKMADKTSVTAAGQNVVFTLTVKNNGPDTATSLQVADVMQSGLSYVSNTTPSVGTFNASTLLWDIASLASGASAALTITASVNSAGSWTNTATAKSDNTDSNSSNNSAVAMIGLGTVVGAPQKFSACESGTCTNNSRLFTKLAGSGFSLNLAALNGSGVPESTFSSPVSLDLLANSLPASKGSNNCPASQSASIALGSATFAGGTATVDVPAQDTAYADVAVRFSCSASACPPSGLIWCAPDVFAIRPTTLTISSANANADSTGASGTAAPTIKTGASFNLTATAIAGYNGTPLIDISKLQAHGGAVRVGSLAGAFTAADSTAGAASSSNFTYSEVGYFALAVDGVYDGNFTSVDSADGDCTPDFSNTAAGGQYGCKFGNTDQTGYFGRFIPAHLVTQVLSNGSFAHACSTFTYNGQPLGYGTGTHPLLSVYAYNASSPAAVTQNYAGKFARLLASQFVLNAPTSDALQKGVDDNLVKLNATLASPSLIDNGNGNLTLVLGNDSFTYQREANALIAPFSNAIGITVGSVADSDGVTASTLPMILQPSGENIRYGRVNLMNGYGSELTDLAVPMIAEYYNGKSFVTNTEDRCSVATIAITDPLTSDSLQTSDSCIWDNGGLSGSAKCTGTAPSGESYVEGSGLSSGSFNLYLKAPSKTGSLTVNAGVANWLRFNWQGAGEANPSATASFGVYKGNNAQIYLREIY